MRHLKSETVIAAAAAAAAQIYRKPLLRYAPICDFSRRSLSAAAEIGENYERKRLPAELSALGNVAELTCDSAARGGVCYVYLVGTRHRTQKYREQVKAIIEFVKPQVVFLEMCPDRAHFLKPKNASRGGEFYVAYKEAIKHGAEEVILGDRPFNITMGRIQIMPYFWERVAYTFTISSIIKRTQIMIKRYYEKDARGASLLEHDWIVRTMPSFCEVFGNERDQYMSATLLEVARRHHSVVAVVGEAHLPGIQKHWKQPVDMKQLLHVPTRKRVVTIIRRILLELLL